MEASDQLHAQAVLPPRKERSTPTGQVARDSQRRSGGTCKNKPLPRVCVTKPTEIPQPSLLVTITGGVGHQPVLVRLFPVLVQLGGTGHHARASPVG